MTNISARLSPGSYTADSTEGGKADSFSCLERDRVRAHPASHPGMDRARALNNDRAAGSRLFNLPSLRRFMPIGRREDSWRSSEAHIARRVPDFDENASDRETAGRIGDPVS